MKFKRGQKVLLRNGDIAVIVEARSENIYPNIRLALDGSGNPFRTSDGRMNSFESANDSTGDIIEIISEVCTKVVESYYMNIRLFYGRPSLCEGRYLSEESAIEVTEFPENSNETFVAVAVPIQYNRELTDSDIDSAVLRRIAGLGK